MKPIESFSIDHNNLLPGVYERYTKNDVKTWDVRFKKPNNGEYLKPEAVHTLEHFLATYLKNVMDKDTIYGVFPMGCLTGFYILTSARVSKRTLVVALLGAHSYIQQSEEIPGATEESCGNYKFQDLVAAKEEIHKFYEEVLSSCEKEVLDDLLNDNHTEDSVND